MSYSACSDLIGFSGKHASPLKNHGKGNEVNASTQNTSLCVKRRASYMSQPTYHVKRDGRKAGPFTGQQLKKLAALGKLKWNDLIVSANLPDREIPARRVRGLTRYFTAPAKENKGGKAVAAVEREGRQNHAPICRNGHGAITEWYGVLKCRKCGYQPAIANNASIANASYNADTDNNSQDDNSRHAKISLRQRGLNAVICLVGLPIVGALSGLALGCIALVLLMIFGAMGLTLDDNATGKEKILAELVKAGPGAILGVPAVLGLVGGFLGAIKAVLSGASIGEAFTKFD